MSFDPANLTQQLIHATRKNMNPPSTNLPLGSLEAIADIEARAKKCLEGCRTTGDPFVDGCLLNVDKVKEILLATAEALFPVRSGVLESQPGSGTELLEQAIGECIDGTFRLVPIMFAYSLRYKESKGDIASALERRLRTMATDRLSRSAAASGGAFQRGRGRPMEISVAAKERALEAKRSGAPGRKVAQLLYETRYPSAQQVKNTFNVLAYYERTRERLRNPFIRDLRPNSSAQLLGRF